MAYRKLQSVSILAKLLLALPLLSSYANALHSHHHAHLHRQARGAVGGEDSAPAALPDTLNGRSPHPAALALQVASVPSAGQDDFTCGPGKPCSNEACCGPDGWCGYEPKYCGKGCQSNCDAKAECGKYAKKPGQGCPLNVCCSKYGFCGSTKDFCTNGCQSNCDQPKPSGPKTDTQQKVIGYWEGWNTNHACGTMTLGEIPVDLLTHLNIAFGFIDKDFRITNMDGVSADMYKNVGNLKAKNPDLKIIIALGGWTFSDPGPWQAIFPSLASSQSNRAIFIENLLGFLDEYGYDGVDFDWEYPGDKDRGGSEKDTDNLVSLVKELQSAIKSSGREYIVTYTAPTSYWYLRHFDPKAMEPYVDWINLMSYDLHGTWDRNSSIGSQVLAHSNLTEIDLALDLFWRVGVKPEKIVLGLGFYGRSFKLDSPSCWKPGCSFGGPGEKGPCTDSAGILSYREIQDILSKTGATSYHDKKAAVRYFVYGHDNWISYDDATTFRAKIDYANKMGLSGLMVWAIDQDDSQLSALMAVTDGESKGRSSIEEFDLVDLDRLFPKEYIPSDTSGTEYGLVTFGPGSESGELDPTNSAFGFLIAVGESHGLTQLKKRDGRPDPFVFLDCPERVLDQPIDKPQKARVVCTSEDVQGCFRVTEKGVEGTMVEMPDECAPNSFARAISLELAEDQTIPSHLRKRHIPTSPIFEFSFDFNKNERRADSKVAIRMDITNVKGYWDGLVDSPGVSKRDLERRYHSFLSTDWEAEFEDNEKLKYDTYETALKIRKDLSTPVFWQAADTCPVGDEDFGEGIAAFIEGGVKADMYYSATVIATASRGDRSVDVKQANGFIKLSGDTDLTFGIGGMGRLDIDQARKGNPAKSAPETTNLGGHMVNAGKFWGHMNLTPFMTTETTLATAGRGRGPTTGPSNAATFNGRLTARVKTDLGNFPVSFPQPVSESFIEDVRKHHEPTEIQIYTDDILYGDGGTNGSLIQIGHSLIIGIRLNFAVYPLKQPQGDTHWTEPTEMVVMSQTYATWDIPEEKNGRVCPELLVGTSFRQLVEKPENLNWNDTGEAMFFSNNTTPTSQVCYSVSNKRATSSDGIFDPPMSLAKRGRKSPKDFFGVMNMRPEDALMRGANLFMEQNLDRQLGEIKCDNGRCESCLDNEETRHCCGCVCMLCKFGEAGDMPPCDGCNLSPDWVGAWPGDEIIMKRAAKGIIDLEVDEQLNDLQPRARAIRPTIKKINVCKEDYWADDKAFYYPPFPANARKRWDGVDNGIYDEISTYWGNASADCVNWHIKRHDTHDVLHLGNGIFARAGYQMEHVYEGQTLGRFFNEWLTTGQIERQDPAPGQTTGKVDCAWIDEWITVVKKARDPWTNPIDPGERWSLFDTLASELGNNYHKDRLAILLTRLNRKKEHFFKLEKAYNPSSYVKYSVDEQWMTVKEIGLVFRYMNNPTIWTKWCDTFNGIRTRLDRFDSWYAANKGVNDPDVTLADEWDQYHRVTLDSIVNIYRKSWDFLYSSRTIVPGPDRFTVSWEERQWRFMKAANYLSNTFVLSRPCPNLPQGPFG